MDIKGASEVCCNVATCVVVLILLILVVVIYMDSKSRKKEVTAAESMVPAPQQLRAL